VAAAAAARVAAAEAAVQAEEARHRLLPVARKAVRRHHLPAVEVAVEAGQ
jgi:hypothetical protein